MCRWKLEGKWKELPHNTSPIHSPADRIISSSCYSMDAYTRNLLGAVKRPPSSPPPPPRPFKRSFVSPVVKTRGQGQESSKGVEMGCAVPPPHENKPPSSPVDMDNNNNNNNNNKGSNNNTEGRRTLPCCRISPTPAKSEIPANKKETPLTRYYVVMWCKASNKKHKTWNDGVMHVTGNRYVLLDGITGKEIGWDRITGMRTLGTVLVEGTELFLGNKEVEVVKQVDGASYLSGSLFLDPNKAPSISEVHDATPPVVTKRSVFKPLTSWRRTSSETPTSTPPPQPAVYPADALVLYKAPYPPDPNIRGWRGADVVIDQRMARLLKPHQKEALHFLFNRVMGIEDPTNLGALYADDVGLGKTFTTLALFHALCTHNIIWKALVICPVTLVSNWEQEVKKWLGSQRCRPLVMGDISRDKARSMIHEFITSKVRPLMILSYEAVRSYNTLLANAKCELVICDEGHRLKNSEIKTTKAIAALGVQRRIILTATPVQNDLSELYALADFCNPGILGEPRSFRSVFEGPINNSRDVNINAQQRSLGNARASELQSILSSFTLRRTAVSVLADYLPPKVEQVICVKPSRLQCDLYRFFTSRFLRGATDGQDVLKHITFLKKVCNHPFLVLEKCTRDSTWEKALEYFPPPEERTQPRIEDSGKFLVLEGLLHEARARGDHVVLVSSYRQTLNLLEVLCNENGFSFERLDGETPQGMREGRVRLFNSGSVFAFLLSARAGGAGLNLVAANRLFLLDGDWNPAIDEQAKGRVWRFGQTKPVVITRLMLTGTIDEKIFQRQIKKLSLGATLIDEAYSAPKFTAEELKDLFSFKEDTVSDTHDLLECTRCSGGEDPIRRRRGMRRLAKQGNEEEEEENNGGARELERWNHYNDISLVPDSATASSASVVGSTVSFVFFRPATSAPHTTTDAPVTEGEESDASGPCRVVLSDAEEEEREGQ